MSKVLIFAAVALCFGLTGGVAAQADRAQGLAAALDKTKYKKKEKKNISVEVFVEIKNSPAVKGSPVEYTGSYASENDDHRLDVRVAADGSAEGSGHDTLYGDGRSRVNFTLKDARVDGAVLKATKVFADGRAEQFEGVFVNRTIVQGKNANEIAERKTYFGLGFVATGKSWTSRVFLEGR